MCLGCGEKNPRGLQLKFDLDAAHRRIRTRWIPTKEFQGYADIVHGGMIGLVLDELMVNLLWKLQRPSMTAELTLRFLQPARIGEPIECEGWIASEKGSSSRRVYQMEAQAKNPAGQTIARAHARCVQVG